MLSSQNDNLKFFLPVNLTYDWYSYISVINVSNVILSPRAEKQISISQPTNDQLVLTEGPSLVPARIHMETPKYTYMNDSQTKDSVYMVTYEDILPIWEIL